MAHAGNGALCLADLLLKRCGIQNSIRVELEFGGAGARNNDGKSSAVVALNTKSFNNNC